MNNSNTRIGYSDRISHPDFHKKNVKGFDKKQQNMFLIIVFAAMAGILLYGYFTDDLKGSAIISFAILAVSMLYFSGLKNRQSVETTYDGTIKYIEKQTEVIKKTKYYLRTLIILNSDDGKEFVYNNIISSTKNDYTDYYKVGDKVRHHYGFDLPEKYDKSKDEKAVCILCGKLDDINNDNCSKCGKTLLK